MRFLVLGPLEVLEEGGDPVPIAGSKERSILAFLIAAGGRVVPADDLLEALWGDDRPRTADKTLGSYVSKLRRALEPARSRGSTADVVVTRGDGYALATDGCEIDAVRFEQLAADGHRHLEEGSPHEARPLLEEALALWRGAAYEEYRHTGFGDAESDRLEELRRTANEDHIDTRLAAGDARLLIAELEAMVRQEPLRERRWAQLMVALYRAERQAEALNAFVRARAMLVEELGIEPGPKLQQLHMAILGQDPALLGHRPRRVEVASTDVCPYKGLARFEMSDAEFFFGREQLITEAMARLVGDRFLALVGPSGSGKSSLLRAGVLHALGAGALPGSGRWTCVLLRPGDHPLQPIMQAIAAVPGEERCVVAIDQFEEFFTACDDEEERSASFDALTEAVLVPDGPVTLLIAMRSDYYGRCVEHRPLANLLAQCQILVGPMQERELRRAVELPAERAGLSVEGELSDALMSHTRGQPGALPLLSTTLLELWRRRKNRTLGLEDYLRTGGLEGAVARLAEDAYGRLDADGQDAARRVLLRLARSGERADVVRRRALLSEFDLDRDENASRVMVVLTDARLVTISEGAVEVAHEALLTEWPRLRGWLEDDVEGRKLHRHLTESSRTWDEGGRDDADLYRGARLTATLDWAGENENTPNDLERTFLSASRTLSEGDASRTRRTNRRLRGLLAGVAVLLALSLVVGNLALRQRDDARAASAVADARQLAARSLTEEDLTLSLLLAREAVALDDSPATRSALLSALQRSPAVIASMHTAGATTGDDTLWLALSPDDRTIAVGGDHPTVELFDASTYDPIGAIDVLGATTMGAFSPDSRTLALAGSGGQIVSADVAKRTVTVDFSSGNRRIDAIAYTPDGLKLLSAESTHDRGFLARRDPVSLEPIGPIVPVRGRPVQAMALSQDGHWLVTTSLAFNPLGGIVGDKVANRHGQTVLWTSESLTPARPPFPVGGNDIAVSPDSRSAAIAGSRIGQGEDLAGHLVLLDLRTGEMSVSRTALSGPQGWQGMSAVSFSMDGRSVFSTGGGGMTEWDVHSATTKRGFRDPARLSVGSPVLSSDGETAFTIDLDGNVVAWDLMGDRSLVRSFVGGTGATSWGPWFASSPDGKTLAITQASCCPGRGSVRLVDTETLEGIGIIRYNRYGTSWPEGLAFSTDSATIAVTSDHGYVQLWDVATVQPKGPPLDIPGRQPLDLWAMPTFSSDGVSLAAAGRITDSNRGVGFLWDLASGTSGRYVGRLPAQEEPVGVINFSPDGSLLIVSSFGGDAVVWSVIDRAIVRTIHADASGIYAADIANDGIRLVTGGQSSNVQMWDLRTGGAIGPAYDGLKGATHSVDISPDGGSLVASDDEGRVLLWDVDSGTLLGESFPGRSEDDLAASFDPDGRRVYIVSSTGRGWVWDVDPSSWIEKACQIAGRNLSQVEWQTYLPSRPYRATCGS